MYMAKYWNGGMWLIREFTADSLHRSFGMVTLRILVNRGRTVSA